jgi:hypothetical protein
MRLVQTTMARDPESRALTRGSLIQWQNQDTNVI